MSIKRIELIQEIAAQRPGFNQVKFGKACRAVGIQNETAPEYSDEAANLIRAHVLGTPQQSQSQPQPGDSSSALALGRQAIGSVMQVGAGIGGQLYQKVANQVDNLENQAAAQIAAYVAPDQIENRILQKTAALLGGLQQDYQVQDFDFLPDVDFTVETTAYLSEGQ